MTISTTTYKATYTGDDADTTFDFSFPILDEDHLVVELRNTSTGVITTQTITTHYTVSGSGNDSGRTNYTSGTVTFVTAPSSSEQIIITRATPRKQETDYTPNDAFPAETHEEALDRLTMIAQELSEQVERSFKLDSVNSDSILGTIEGTPTAGYTVQVNADGDGLTFASDSSALGDLSKADGTFYVGDGTDVVAESGSTARDSLGLGTSDAVEFSTVTVASDVIHSGDTNNKVTFTTDTQTFTTGGSTRMDITDSGVQLGGSGARVTTILDEDDMSSDSATALSTQQATKAYVDTAVAGAGGGSAGAWEHVATYTLSADSDVEIPLATANTLYYIQMFNIVVASGSAVQLQCEVSDDNGSSYKTGASDYRWAFGGPTLSTGTYGASADSSDDSFVFSDELYSSGNPGVMISLQFFNGDGTNNPCCHWQNLGVTSAQFGGGLYLGSATLEVDKLRIFPASSTFSGKITVSKLVTS